MLRSASKLIFLVTVHSLSLGFLGCNNYSDRYSSVYQIFSETTLEHVEIDEEKILDLKLNQISEVSGLKTLPYFTGTDFLIHQGEYLVTVHNKRKSILILDQINGDIIDEYSFLGRGPGEYQRIDHLLHSDNYFLIIDSTLGKVLKFNNQFQFEKEYAIKDMFPRSGFAYNHPIFYYPISNNPNYLLSKISLRDSSISNSFHHRIISMGKQPRDYNRILMDANSIGELIIGSVQMPLLFFYGTNSELDNMYRLHYSDFKLEPEQVEFDSRIGEQVLSNPPPIEIETNQVIRGRNLISKIRYRKDKIYLIHSGIITILKKSGSDINHVKSLRLFDQDGKPFYPMYITQIDTELIVSSKFRDFIIRINMDLID